MAKDEKIELIKHYFLVFGAFLENEKGKPHMDERNPLMIEKALC